MYVKKMIQYSCCFVNTKTSTSFDKSTRFEVKADASEYRNIFLQVK